MRIQLKFPLSRIAQVVQAKGGLKIARFIELVTVNQIIGKGKSKEKRVVIQRSLQSVLLEFIFNCRADVVCWSAIQSIGEDPHVRRHGCL